jgi:hypothetical protein
MGSLKSKKGYHLVIIDKEADDGDCQIFSFDTKEEFEEQFDTKPHAYYPCNMYIPKNIIELFGNSVTCIICDKEYHIDLDSTYLVIDGCLVNGDKSIF